MWLGTGDGIYLIKQEPGTVNMTAGKPGYQNATASDVQVIEGEVTYQDFELTPGTMMSSSGNIIGYESIDLTDAIFTMKIVAGVESQVCACTNLEADVNGDNKIGLEEAVYILQYLAGLHLQE